MKKSILITGGAGFIGSRLAVKLLDAGHRVRVLDSLISQIHGANPERSPLYRTIAGKVEFVRACVTDQAAMRQALEGVDTVVHLAAETGTGQSMYAIKHYVDVNVGGTAVLLDLIANEQPGVRKIVVASSRAVYGEGKYRCGEHGAVYPDARSAGDMQRGDFSPHCPQCGEPVEPVATDESTPVRPASIYGITKLNQEQMVLTVAKALGISAAAFRYQNVYGPGQSLSNPYTGILSIFSTRIRNGSGINVFEDGKETRDFVFIDDVVAATERSIEYDLPLNDVFNVGSGEATDVMTIVRLLQQLFGRQVEVRVSGQFRAGDIRHNFADLRKVGSVLGFAPQVTIEDGLRRFVDWVKQQDAGEDRYEESLKELTAKGLFKGGAA